jgi:phage/plasmid-like protein (TIGR03299 family)
MNLPANFLGFTSSDKSVYFGKQPWEGVGTQLNGNESIIEISEKAGLDFSVKEKTVHYKENDSFRAFTSKKVLVRSDTGRPLSVVSSGYNTVQPEDIVSLYADLSEIGGFSLETAGTLQGGKKIWALARVSEDAPVLENDPVSPYVLLATSFDGTLATVGLFTSIRVSCCNTLSASLGKASFSETSYLSDSIKINHSSKFDKDKMRMRLGIFADSFEKFLINARNLANQQMSDQDMDLFLKTLLSPYHRSEKKEIEDMKAFKSIKALFNGSAIGHKTMLKHGAKNRYLALNCVTEFVDHSKGITTDSRINSAFFGSGSKLKKEAAELLAA